MPHKLFESYFSKTIKKCQLQAKPLVLARSPHAPPRLPWSRTRPRFLRLLWSTLPITVVGSRQPYRSSGEAFCVKEQLSCPCAQLILFSPCVDFDAKPSTSWLQHPKCTAPASFITMVRPSVPDVNPKQFNTSAHDALMSSTSPTHCSTRKLKQGAAPGLRKDQGDTRKRSPGGRITVTSDKGYQEEGHPWHKGHHTGRDPAHQNLCEGQADPTSATILVGNQITKTQAKGRRTRQLHFTLVSFNTKLQPPSWLAQPLASFVVPRHQPLQAVATCSPSSMRRPAPPSGAR